MKIALLSLVLVGLSTGKLAQSAPTVVVAALGPIPSLEQLKQYRGTSLDDLNFVLAKNISGYVKATSALKMKRVISVSIHSLDLANQKMEIDIFGQDKAFQPYARGLREGLGLIRVEVQFDQLSRVTGHKIVLQRDYVDMKPSVRVSLGDRLAVLSDEATGFRRSFPLGVGAIDDVRFPGVTTLMTPTTEWSVLKRDTLWRARHSPSYFRGKPFIPLNIPVEPPKEGKPVRYRVSSIAFHIWQSPGFERGFLSHGCMRMRTTDLDEMLELVVGSRTGEVPVVIRAERVAGAAHPFPYLTGRHNTVKNYGTKQKPMARRLRDKEGVYLTHTIGVKAAPPAIESLTGVTTDPVPVGPVPGGLLERDNLF